MDWHRTSLLCWLHFLGSAFGFVVYNPSKADFLLEPSDQRLGFEEVIRRNLALPASGHRPPISGGYQVYAAPKYEAEAGGQVGSSINVGKVRDLDSFLLGARFGQKVELEHEQSGLMNPIEIQSKNIQEQVEEDWKQVQNILHSTHVNLDWMKGSSSSSPSPAPVPDWGTPQIIWYTGTKDSKRTRGTLKVVPYPFTVPGPITVAPRDPTPSVETHLSSSSKPPLNASLVADSLKHNVSGGISTPNPGISNTSLTIPDPNQKPLPLEELSELGEIPFLPKLGNVSEDILAKFESGNLTLDEFVNIERQVQESDGASFQDLTLNVTVPPVTLILDQIAPANLSNWSQNQLGSNTNLTVLPLVISGPNQSEPILAEALPVKGENFKEFYDLEDDLTTTSA